MVNALDETYRELKALFGDRVMRDEPMSRHTSYRIGGPADLFVVARETRELATLLQFGVAHELPILWLGSGTNLLVADAGIRGLTVAECARRLGVERTVLFRHVVAVTGRNPQTHIHDARVAHACALLRETGQSLDAIARRCGYANASNLNVAFRARFPVSPGRWRQG